jgi:hypothetical protein
MPRLFASTLIRRRRGQRFHQAILAQLVASRARGQARRFADDKRHVRKRPARKPLRQRRGIDSALLRDGGLRSRRKSSIRFCKKPAACRVYVASTCGMNRKLWEFVRKNSVLAVTPKARPYEPSLKANALILLLYFGSGGGTRTPDTRIMIPLL